MDNYRLTKENLKDLVEFAKDNNFSSKFDKDFAKNFVDGSKINSPRTQTYGIYIGKELAAIATATFSYIFPNDYSKNGKTVYISNLYTLEKYRNRGIATILLKAIETDAINFGADTMFCEATLPLFLQKHMFINTSYEEKRMWKKL